MLFLFMCSIWGLHLRTVRHIDSLDTSTALTLQSQHCAQTFREAWTSCITTCVGLLVTSIDNVADCFNTHTQNYGIITDNVNLQQIVLTHMYYCKWPNISQLTYFPKPDKTLLSKRLRQACICEINGFPSFKRTNHY